MPATRIGRRSRWRARRRRRRGANPRRAPRSARDDRTVAGQREQLADIWRYPADTGCRGDSPLYDRICRYVGDRDAVLHVVLAAPPAGHFPNVLLGAVHYLLLGGLDHPLATVYAGTSDADAGPLCEDLCPGPRPETVELLAPRHTNTNEVGRSAVLGPALTTVAGR